MLLCLEVAPRGLFFSLGVLINLTATFSYAVCSACEELNWLPALGQMQTLLDAMSYPELYGRSEGHRGVLFTPFWPNRGSKWLLLEAEWLFRCSWTAGYVPKNNVTEAFFERWVHSFNTNNPARDLRQQFFEHYPQHFGDLPVFVAEYHSPILHYLGLTLPFGLANEP